MIAAAIAIALVYPHSLIPGGIDIWSGFPTVLAQDTTAYVDYRADDGRIAWAKTTLKKGEVIITDRYGVPLRRARCGNDVSLSPPPGFVPPHPPDLDIPGIVWTVPPDLDYPEPGIEFHIPDVPQFVPPAEVIPPPVVSFPPPRYGVVIPPPVAWWGVPPVVVGAGVPEPDSFYMMTLAAIFAALMVAITDSKGRKK